MFRRRVCSAFALLIFLSLLDNSRSSEHRHDNDDSGGASSDPKVGGPDPPPSWYDCSSEVGIPPSDAVLAFSDVRSDPEVVTPKSGQRIYKTITYDADADADDDAASSPSSSAHPTLEEIAVDFHQYYKLFDRRWTTFLVVHGVNECDEHETLCPLRPGETKEVVTVHPPLNPLTPYGWYRSRQVYKDGATGRRVGCVDMKFRYAPEGKDRRDGGALLRGGGAGAIE